MGTVRYTILDGQIVAEKRGASRKFYASDALGSTVALYDNTQTKTDSFTYWPYGETRTSTSSTGTRFKYIGTLGCRTQLDGGIYMRARVLQPHEGRWTTPDPFWPLEVAYEYSNGSPATWTDASGLWTKKTGHCKATIITPGKGDRTGVVVGHRGNMIRGGTAISAFRRPGENCIAVNGGFFGPKPVPGDDYVLGNPSWPSGDVIDCKGNKYDDSQPNKPIEHMPVITGAGRITGRPPSKPGGASKGQVTRTGACTDDRGNLISMVVIPGVDFDQFEKCMKQICPKKSKIVLLDGGGSSQIVTNPNHNSGRPIHNWIVICSD